MLDGFSLAWVWMYTYLATLLPSSLLTIGGRPLLCPFWQHITPMLFCLLLFVYGHGITQPSLFFSDIVVPRPVVVRRTSQSAKRSTFSHKMGKKWGVCKRVKGVRFKKYTFWVQKVHILGVPHPPPPNRSWLRTWSYIPLSFCLPRFIFPSMNLSTICFVNGPLSLIKCGKSTPSWGLRVMPQLMSFQAVLFSHQAHKAFFHRLFSPSQKNPKWVIWLIWATVGHYTDKMTQKYVKMSLFVRVVTHYGSDESFGFFCVPADLYNNLLSYPHFSVLPLSCSRRIWKESILSFQMPCSSIVFFSSL